MNIYTHHTCIKVSDIEKSKAFYQDALGFTETVMIHHSLDVVSCFMTAPDGGIQIQLLQLPSHTLECMGYGHLGMRVDDIQSSFAFHSQMGCVSAEIIEQPHQYGYFIKDPDGYETELVQLR